MMKDYSVSGDFGKAEIYNTCIPSLSLYSIDHVTAMGWHKVNQLYSIDRPSGANSNLLIFTKCGKGALIVNGISFLVEEGSVSILPKDVPHKYYALPECEWEFYWLHYYGTCSQTITDDITSKKHYDFPFDTWEMESYFNRLRKSAQNTIESECNISRILNTMLFDILTGYITKGKDINATNFVECLISDIESWSKSSFNLSEIVSKYHYSKEHIIRQFSVYTGKTPYNYWKCLKFQLASKQLLCSDEPIGEIGKKAGYNKLSSFTNEFKKIFHMSPSEYRKAFKVKGN